MAQEDYIKEILREYPALAKIYNPSNVAVTFAPKDRTTAAGQNILEWWPPSESGSKDFPRPSGYEGKTVLEFYKPELQKNPSELKQLIYGDLLHGLDADPYFAKLKDEFSRNWTKETSAYRPNLKARGLSDKAIDDMYIRGWLAPSGDDEFRKAQASGRNYYSLKQLQILSQMQQYLKTGKEQNARMSQDQQSTYIALPNGSYVQIPRDATPEQLGAFKTRLRSFSKASGMSVEQQTAKEMGIDEEHAISPANIAKATRSITGGTPAEQLEANLTRLGIKIGPDEKKALLDIRERQKKDPAFARLMDETFSYTAPGNIKRGIRDALIGAGTLGAGELVPELVELGTKAVPEVAPLGIRALRTVGLGGARALGAGAGSAVGQEVTEGKIDPAQVRQTAEAVGGGSLLFDTGAGAAAAAKRIFASPQTALREATERLATEMGPENLSPAQFGAKVQESFDQISKMAGQEKGEIVRRIAQEAPNARITYKNTLNTLQKRVNILEHLKQRNPALFAEGESYNKTLNILKQELNATRSEVSAIEHPRSVSNIADADARRSQYFNYKMDLHPKVAEGIIADLNQALTKDVLEGVGAVNQKLADQYIAASNRYRQIQEIGRADVLSRIFGDGRVSPDKVVKVMAQAPEDSLRAIRSLYSGNPQAIAQLRRTLFEHGMQAMGPGNLMKMQPQIIREVFGPQADAVTDFVRAIKTSAKPGAAENLVSKIPGRLGRKAGALIRIVNAFGNEDIYIDSAEFSKILKSANMMRMWTQAAEMPATAGPANSLRQMLIKSLQASEAVPLPRTMPGPKRRPLWAQERRTSSTPRRQTEGTSPTGTERRKTFLKGVTTQYDLPTEGEQLEQSMRQVRAGETSDIGEGQVMQRIMRDPKRYEEFRNADRKTQDKMLVEEKNRMLERRKS